MKTSKDSIIIFQQKLTTRIKRMRKALLVFHSPVDEIVGIENAGEIFQAALHPKSFVSLDTADHLLSRRQDSAYVAETIAAWASRYVLIDAQPIETRPAVADGAVLVREQDGKFAQEIYTDKHQLIADEPVSYGGTDSGPSPYEYLLAGLGACTAMTLRMYAQRRQIPLDHVAVTLQHTKIHATDCSECETKEGRVDHIERKLTLRGTLSDEQRAKLLEIADKCPVHRTLHAEVLISTGLLSVEEA